jgi:hypothetical protein
MWCSGVKTAEVTSKILLKCLPLGRDGKQTVICPTVGQAKKRPPLGPDEARDGRAYWTSLSQTYSGAHLTATSCAWSKSAAAARLLVVKPFFVLKQTVRGLRGDRWICAA